MKPAEGKEVVIQSVGGLEIETTEILRAPNTWRRLENWDLLVPGAIRKIRGIELLNENKYNFPIVTFREYKRKASDLNPMLLGLSGSGHLYNLQVEPATVLAQFFAVKYPFVALMNGLADGASTPIGTPNPASTVQYFITTTSGFFPQKWDGLGAPTVLGVEAPTEPALITLLVVAQVGGGSAINLPGTVDNPIESISIEVSRQYAYTYWNPTTKHESSRSPVSRQATIDSDQYPALALFPLIRQVRINTPTGPLVYGDGYTRKRLYATRDGAEEFDLVTGAQYWDGVALQPFDSDGSMPLEFVEALDGVPSVAVLPYYILTSAVSQPSTVEVQFSLTQESITPLLPTRLPIGPLVTLGTAIQAVGGIQIPSVTDVNVSPTVDQTLVEPGPTIDENNPPPTAIWGAVYQGRLWLLDATNQARVVFSKVADFQSFPIDNFFIFDSDDYNPVVALVSQYISLLIGKRRSINAVSGTSFTDFTNIPIDPQVGLIARRTIAMVEGQLFFYSSQGIMRLASSTPSFDGHLIRPLVDNLDRTEAFERLPAAANTSRGIVVMAFRKKVFDEGETENDSLILLDLSQQSPFSIVKGFNRDVYGMDNVLVPGDNAEGILLGLDDSKVYRLFSGDVFPLSSTLPAHHLHIDAYAETQLLPQDDPHSRKVFRRFIVEMPSYDGMQYSWSIDNEPFSPTIPLRRNNFLGRTGKQVSILLEHTGIATAPVLITGFKIEYVEIGESR